MQVNLELSSCERDEVWKLTGHTLSVCISDKSNVKSIRVILKVLRQVTQTHLKSFQNFPHLKKKTLENIFIHVLKWLLTYLIN